MTKDEELQCLLTGPMTDERAEALLDSEVGRQVFLALDLIGWKVAHQTSDDEQWPVPLATQDEWPSWCNHEFSYSEMVKRGCDFTPNNVIPLDQ